MPRIIKPILLVALLIGATPARPAGYAESKYEAQTMWTVAWEGAVPLTSFRSFVSTPSPRGLHLEVDFGVARHFSFGLAAGWNWFSQTVPGAEMQFPDAVVTGTGYRRLQVIGIGGTAHWYVTNGPLQPRLGITLGGGWRDSYVSVGSAIQTNTGYYAAAGTTLGLVWTVAQGFALLLQGSYTITTARFENVKNASWAALDVGLCFY